MAPPDQWSIDKLHAGLPPHASDLNPSVQDLDTLMASHHEGPLQFLNLLAYHRIAQYPRDHELARRSLSGAEAYARYGAVALRQVTIRGGRLSLYNDVSQVLIGDDSWDQVAIMEYPNPQAFLDMIVDPDYTSALIHRDAGLARTRLLVTTPLLVS